MSARLLTIMGSGETSPTMVRVHREVFERLGREASGVVLEAPYAFQENAEEISRKAVEYFRVSVGRPFEVARVRPGLEALEAERELSRLRTADCLFAGPGSPTYALRVWRDVPVADLFRDKLRRGGALTFASGAALTLGALTVPVYEIYKVGEDPRWVEGLDVTSELGLSVAVIPHFDNAEGGTHDTRFCYLGLRRLRIMEEQLPEETFILGVDEHTACLLDAGRDELEVIGRGRVTIRRGGRAERIEPGSPVPLAELRHDGGAGLRLRPAEQLEEVEVGARTPFEEEVGRLEEAFETALAGRDADSAVQAMLELDDLIEAWSADPSETDAPDRARFLLRSMAVRLGRAGHRGLRHPEEAVGPLVSLLLEVRDRARREGRWEQADAIRDGLVELGVEVRDAREGTTWSLVRWW